MTRFARARGSKASNEKAPEDSTPWEVMKDQLLQSKKQNEEAKAREDAEKKRIENYEKFLKDQKTQKRKATWCDFPETVSVASNNVSGINGSSPAKKKKKNKNKSTNSDNEVKKNNLQMDSILNHPSDMESENKKNMSNLQVENKRTDNEESSKANEVSDKKNKKKKKKKNKGVIDNNVTEQVEKNVETPQSKDNKLKHENNAVKSNTKQKNKKMLDGPPARRKPINDRSFDLIINGKKVELVRFDGFPVMKKDGERLQELKENMMKKGIPKSEVQRTLKLERRRAEKALARMKRDVCYNCRKGGHNLSDCPELKSKIPGVDAAEGVCFKCGSTEHRQFECKVQRDKEFRFATCFICKDQGHIARQCPDNPKGLYPNGGCCKLCGDVTHLRKDCPTINDKKEETSIKLHTFDSSQNIEDVEQNKQNTVSEPTSKKPKKIKF